MAIPPDARLVLDTWVLVRLLRGQASGRVLVDRYELFARPVTPFISIVTHGELYAFARGRAWGGEKRDRLDALLAQLVTVDVNSRDVLDAFADVSTYLRERGRTVGDNDRWIAATARVLDAVVLTGDRDFAPLDPDMVRCEVIDERTLLA